MRQQRLGCLLRGEAGNSLGHEILAHRPVDEPARNQPGVIVFAAEGRDDVIKRPRRQGAKPDGLGTDLIRPGADARDWVDPRLASDQAQIPERSQARVPVERLLIHG